MFMIRTATALVLLSSAFAVTAQKPRVQPGNQQAQLTRSIEDVLKVVSHLKPGMTRKDVLRTFTTEGGISSRSWNHYVYRICPYIKVDVTFDIPQTADQATESPDDRIATISKPYLEYSFTD